MPHRTPRSVESRIRIWRKKLREDPDGLDDKIRKVLELNPRMSTTWGTWNKREADELIQATRKVGFRPRDLAKVYTGKTAKQISGKLR